MYEKLIWISSFMLIGALNGGVSVGEAESNYRQDVTDLIEDLCAAVTSTQGVKFVATIRP